MLHKVLIYGFVSHVALLIWEDWLARTERFVAGSSIQLIQFFLRWIISKIKSKFFP